MSLNLKGIRKTCIRLMAFGLALGFSTSFAANTTVDLQAQATIQRGSPNFTVLQDLDLGQIKLQNFGDGLDPETLVAIVTLRADLPSSDALARTVVNNPLNNSLVVGEVVLTGGTNFSRAVFTVSGVPNSTYFILVEDPAVVHDASTGAIPLLVINPKSYSQNKNTDTSGNPVVDPTFGEGITDDAGNDTVFVGGDLQVQAKAVNGGYTGTINVTVFH